MPPNPEEPSETLHASGIQASVPFAPDQPVAEAVFGDELRRLLRSRLIWLHLLSLATGLLLGALSIAVKDQTKDQMLRPDMGSPWILAVAFAECLIGVFVLWRSPAIELRSLRRWEIAHFVILAAYNGLVRFWMLAHVDGGSPDPRPLAIAFSGAVSLHGPAALILVYGVMVPNTRSRALLGVTFLTALPVVATLMAIVANAALRETGLAPLLFQCLLNLTVPAAIAAFAASRADSLLRRAFEAERRAERIGQYTLKRKLGEGGMGEVWLAEHGLLKRPCAVKFIRLDRYADTAAKVRFIREVQAVTRLTHVNTVRVYDYGHSDDGSLYYVMEYLEGPTLEELVTQSGPLPPARVVFLLRQVCGALEEAHAADLVHRDIKPGNIMIANLGGQEDVAKLLDFGLVQDLSTVDTNRLTRTGTVLGTPSYMAPEQAAGESAVDARGDLYALGAVAFFALTGRPPFVETSLGRLLAAQRSSIAPPLQEIRPDVPADLAAIVARCLAKIPDDRFQSARSLAQALSECGCSVSWPIRQHESQELSENTRPHENG